MLEESSDTLLPGKRGALAKRRIQIFLWTGKILAMRCAVKN